jgi:hypothetical protein
MCANPSPFPVSADKAFAIYTGRAIEWIPAAHTFIKGPQSITMEPWPGGRFTDVGWTGAAMTRRTIAEWAPPRRLAAPPARRDLAYWPWLEAHL